MALPPRGDPRRPLMMAVSSCRLLGVLGLLFGTCAGVPLLTGIGRFAGRGGGRALAPDAWLPLTILFGGGTMYLVFAHQLRRRRFWAVVAALVVTALGLLVLLVGLASLLFLTFAVQPGLRHNGYALVPTAFLALVTLALAQLMYHLARSFPALAIVPPDEARGFDVLPIAPPEVDQPIVSDRGK